MDAHWTTNWGWDRFAMSAVRNSDTGTARTEMQASNGLMVSIMMSTPMMVRMAVMSCVRLCWSVWPMLSMSLVTRLSRSPRGRVSKVRRGIRPSFRSTSWRRR